MRRIVSFAVVAALCMPILASAEEPVTRRDGFLLLWEAIKRPAFDSRETPYADVPKGSIGFKEITYGKARGLLRDAGEFFPDAPLNLSDALIMMLRTRNVGNPDDITADSLPVWLKKYPLGDFVDPTTGANGTLVDRKIDAEELRSLMRKFDDLLVKEDHEVSLYAEKWHGKGTAFGESFDMNALTAAHRTYPHNTIVKVTNIANGKSVIVRINDRGPFIEGRDMDLSLASFTTIAERSKGKIRATFERLGDVSMITPEPTVSLKKTGNCPTGKRLERLLARAKRRGVEVAACGS